MIGYYFSGANKRLRYGDNRIIQVGVTHKVGGNPILCQHGLHASQRPLDALNYAPDTWCWKVKLGGAVIHGKDKAVATERTYLAGFDATDVLRVFARRCALDVIHLWDAPDVVVRYLRTGDEAYREAAGAAAGAAARAAALAAREPAGDAAWEAARAAWAARDAAWAARETAGAASWAAGATRGAAGAAGDALDAAGGARSARARQNRRLAQMLAKGFKDVME